MIQTQTFYIIGGRVKNRAFFCGETGRGLGQIRNWLVTKHDQISPNLKNISIFDIYVYQ